MTVLRLRRFSQFNEWEVGGPSTGHDQTPVIFLKELFNLVWKKGWEFGPLVFKTITPKNSVCWSITCPRMDWSKCYSYSVMDHTKDYCSTPDATLLHKLPWCVLHMTQINHVKTRPLIHRLHLYTLISEIIIDKSHPRIINKTSEKHLILQLVLTED